MDTFIARNFAFMAFSLFQFRDGDFERLVNPMRQSVPSMTRRATLKMESSLRSHASIHF